MTLWARAAHLGRELFLLPLHAYRAVIAPNLKPRCRYYPSCSAYGVQAVRELGVVRGSIVAAWRVLRCNPFSAGGVDELADRRLFPDHDHAHPDGEAPGRSGAEPTPPAAVEAPYAEAANS